MPVLIDAPNVPSPDGDLGPMWRVVCESGGEYDRLLLLASDAGIAAKRAEVEFGWRVVGGRVWCREHREDSRG